jgi:hypothetical protein
MKAAGALAVVVLLGAGSGTVAAVQPRIAGAAHAAKERDEVYVLPPPEELRVSTLGWNAAAVDLLWAQLLVEYGTHWAEHREFREAPRYADTILALEPTYRPLYRIIDTLLAYRPLQGTADDVRAARAFLERGMRERPEDARIWVEYGQFLAFIAPSFLPDPAERDAWRRTGAKALGHAVELGADADDALTAATLLDDAGVRSQAILFLEHAYAVTPEDSEVHAQIGARLESLQAIAQRDATNAVQAAFETRRKQELPHFTRGMYRLLGPRIDADRCAGLSGANDPACDRGWADALGHGARRTDERRGEGDDVSADEPGSSASSP